jgi:hypothetical protein
VLRTAVPYASVLAGLYWLRSAWAALLLYHLGMVAYLASTGRLRLPRLPGSDLRAAIAFTAFGLAAWPALYFLWPLARLPGLELSDALSKYGLRGASFVTFAAYYSTLHPLLEEMFWRFETASSGISILEDLLFAGYHLLVLAFFLKPFYIFTVFAILAVSAMSWRRMVLRGGRLEAFLSHAAGDAATMAAAVMLMRR